MRKKTATLGQKTHTTAVKLDVEITSHVKIDDAHQTLISSLELALIKDLHYNFGELLDHAERWLDLRTQETREGDDQHIKRFIPTGTEGLLDWPRCVYLIRIDGEDHVWVRKTENVVFGFDQAIRRED
jgi:hypothetical protein